MLSAGGAIFVAMLLAWIVMSLLFARHLERRLGSELIRDAKQVIAHAHAGNNSNPSVDEPLGDPRYELPSSGRYWQLSADSGVGRSFSLWDETLPETGQITSSKWNTRKVKGPFGQQLFLVERAIELPDDTRLIRVQVAQDLTELARAQHEFKRELALFLALLWALLLGAAWVQVSLGLRPLKKIRQELPSLQKNPNARLEQRYPSEIHPLADAINVLAETREKDLARARRRSADLAHSLKSPLSALSAQSRRARQAGAHDAANGLDRAIASVAAAVEAELARSRAASIRSNTGNYSSEPKAVADRVIRVIERTEHGMRIDFQNEIEEALRLPIAEEDLMDILGALIENAARFAKHAVLITGRQEKGGVSLTVEDDGEGLGISAATALMRGGRLDEAGHGHHGLGLSIVRDLVEASEGEISLESSDLGGLKASLSWPARTNTTD